MKLNIAWDDIRDIAARDFPQAIKSGSLSSTGTKKSKPGFANPSKVRETFGFEMKSLEDMVVDATSQYLEFLPENR
jgi:hypothetical protein